MQGNGLGGHNDKFKLSKGFFGSKSSRVGVGVLAAILIFYLGVGVGNGNITFGLSGVNGNAGQLDYSSVNQVYTALMKNYDGKLTSTQLLNGLKAGLAESTNDPYTEYFTAAQAKQFDDELNNSFSGIGVELGQDSSKDLIIVSPIAGSPAAKAGLKAQDIVTSINGKTTTGMSVDSAVSAIRGTSGTKVILQILRNKTQSLSFTIIRSDVQVPTVTSKILPGNIGYMQISTFGDDTADLAQKAAQNFQSKHVSGIILDLRDNPGGLVTAAVSVSSLWLPQGKLIMQEKRSDNTVVNTYTATGGDILNGIPTAVLVDSGSASASEITTSALHDNKDATVIGEKTYGKGVVQSVINFSDGSELKVTTASWYRPDGQNINKKGITPDQIVTLNDTDAQNGNDTQLNAAESYLKAH